MKISILSFSYKRGLPEDETGNGGGFANIFSCLVSSENLMRNIQERSNGESALAYFVDSIQSDTLYLLDEPENSLSAGNQLKLKYFIEDCMKNYGCQFIISTLLVGKWRHRSVK